MSKKVIEVSQLVKEYDGRPAILDGVSLSIGAGEFVTVYGKSGSGKTTLLNILGGLDKPTSGDVVIDGESIIGFTEDELSRMRLAKVGFVFQDFNLLMDMTVRDNVALPLKFSGNHNLGKVDELLTKFDIAPISGDTVSRISGGEAQRVAIARALINEPKIILADEPTGNLDEDNSRIVVETLQVVARDFGTTIVLATHDKELADYASSIIYLADGKAIFKTPILS